MEIKLTYIHHSGFAIETDRCAVVIDCWRDPAGGIEPLLEGRKPLYVMATHFHEDHFNPAVLGWGNVRPGVTYILSKDILRRRRAPKDAAVWLVKGCEYADANVSVRAFGSTDSGVSLLIRVGNCLLFHAGDLNNWRPAQSDGNVEAARSEAMFLGELKDLRKVVAAVDVAMFPVDARIGSDYMRGPAQFAALLHPRLFVPMHFTASGVASAAAFAPRAAELGCRFWLPSMAGDSLLLP